MRLWTPPLSKMGQEGKTSAYGKSVGALKTAIPPMSAMDLGADRQIATPTETFAGPD